MDTIRPRKARLREASQCVSMNPNLTRQEKVVGIKKLQKGAV